MGTYASANPQAIFYQQYEAVRRDEVVGVLLALFLGTFGVHHFYLRRTGLGVLYCLFFWCGIPTLLGIIECFFMPGRVREFNAIHAAAIAASLGIAVPGWGQQPVGMAVPTPGAALVPPNLATPQAPVAACPKCQRINPATARFCIGCGNSLG